MFLRMYEDNDVATLQVRLKLVQRIVLCSWCYILDEFFRSWHRVVFVDFEK